MLEKTRLILEVGTRITRGCLRLSSVDTGGPPSTPISKKDVFTNPTVNIILQKMDIFFLSFDKYFIL